MANQQYIHGVDTDERLRLSKLNALTNAPFVEFLSLQPAPSRVLDVGSGLGLLAAHVADLVTPGEVIGIEYSATQLAEADTLRVSRNNLSFVRGDAHNLPFADNDFDVVYCRYVLEHLRHPEVAASEMHRVLKPGGRVFIQENDTYLTGFDPDCPHADALVLQFIELQSMLGGDGRIGKRLFGLLKRAGFANVNISLQPELHAHGMESFEVWVKNIISIIVGASDSLIAYGLSSKEKIEAAVEELSALIHREDASALFHWNRACGIK